MSTLACLEHSLSKTGSEGYWHCHPFAELGAGAVNICHNMWTVHRLFFEENFWPETGSRFMRVELFLFSPA